MILNISVDQRTIIGIGGALAALCLLTAGFCAWQWHHDWAIAHQEAITVSSSINKDAELISSLPDAHLFGRSLSGGSVPITNLQLRVTGIVKGNPSKATISIAGEPSQIFQVGDDLPDGVKIYEIMPDAVILENEGKLERLPLPREPLQFKTREEMEMP